MASALPGNRILNHKEGKTMTLLSAVPYDTAIWKQFWNSIMTTIGSASNLGMIIFIALTAIAIFKLVIKYWMNG